MATRTAEETRQFDTIDYYDYAWQVFEVVNNCECAQKYTELECLLMDINPNLSGRYKDIDIRMMYKEFFNRHRCRVSNDRLDIHATFMWDEKGLIDKVQSRKLTMHHNCKAQFKG